MRDVDITIAIVDNASKDRTQEIAEKLAAELPGVQYLRIPEKGMALHSAQVSKVCRHRLLVIWMWIFPRTCGHSC